jgi:hypothetical protein
MSLSFHARFQPLSRFSRAIASFDSREGFEPDERVNVISPRESWRRLGTMLLDPSGQIVGDANIERAVALACEEIDEIHCLDPLPLASLGRG